MEINFDLFLLVGSVLMFISIIAGKTGYRFGVPMLLLFLAIGMVFGSSGVGIQFENPKYAQYIGIVALNIILFSGGLDTRYSEIKPVWVPGVLLATFGVLLTALITGLFIYWLTNNVLHSVTFSLLESFLLAGIMSSTDSASVFSILRSKNLSLKQNLRPLLELESGSNDPMAFMITVVMIQLIQSPEVNGWLVFAQFMQQLIFGAAFGFLLGKFAVRLINRINLDNDALYSVLMLVVMLFIYGITNYLGGNGFLAVYLGGLVIGNSKFIHKRTTMRFFDGLAWLFQIIMFLALGLLVDPKELLPVAGAAILIGFFLMFVARPVAVFLNIFPFKNLTTKAKLFVSWIGLRGAVPIIFATYPWVSGLPQAKMIFNIVFFITIISLLFQGTSVALVAKWFGLSEKVVEKPRLTEFEFEFSDEIKSATCEIKVKKNMLKNGGLLMDMELPGQTLVVMIKRDNQYFVPRGNTKLEVGDSMLVITDNEEAMQDTYRSLGLEP